MQLRKFMRGRRVSLSSFILRPRLGRQMTTVEDDVRLNSVVLEETDAMHAVIDESKGAIYCISFPGNHSRVSTPK